MKKTTYLTSACMAALGLTAHAGVLYQDSFDNDGLSTNNGIGGGAINRTIQAHSWTDDGDATFLTAGTSYTRRALLYSENTFQSDTGFKLTVQFTTGSVGDLAAHNLSFGLIRSNTDLSGYSGYNPFTAEASLYSIGANVTAGGGTASRGLNFSNGTTNTTLDTSGTRAQFVAGETCEVTLEIGIGGYWCYRINGVYESSGVLAEGFDLSQNYHVAIYGQDDHGGGKSIQSVSLETAYAAGERAAGMRGTWNGGQGDVANIKHLKTIGSTIARLNEGASASGTHNAPHNLIESIASGLTAVGGDAISAPVPSWGDLSLDEPQDDPFMAEILEVRNAGIGVKVYSNSENFVGTNTEALESFTERWKEYCDTDPEVQAFINSQPYHTGIWNSTTQQYEDATATYPDRKYMFCYAEYVLKEYSLRYGKYVSSWVFDSADDMAKNGDSSGSGIVEQERIFQAFANAIHAGNPEIPIAFNRGRLGNDLIDDPAFPYARPTRFDDFTFGHAFNGNNDHASLAVNPTRNESIFASNYRHVQKMTEKNGNVHDGGEYEWDDLIVGNFHSKLGPISWQYSTPAAWAQDDFNQWNLEAMQAGGHMTWEGSVTKGTRVLRAWAITQLELLDAHLAEFQNPGPPSWARKYTWLPDASDSNYNHTLVEDSDFWDPEGDNITAITPTGNAPSWLTVSESPAGSGNWVLSGIPTDVTSTTHTFDLVARDSNGLEGSREVTLVVNVSPLVYNDTPREWLANYGIEASDAGALADTDGDGFANWEEYQNGTDPLVNAAPVADSISLTVDEDSTVNITLSGSDAEGNSLSYQVTSQPANGTLSGTAPNLSYTPNADYNGSDSFSYTANDGSSDSSIATVSITVLPVNDLPNAGSSAVVAGTLVSESYSGTLADAVSDTDGDSLTFAVLSGPSWLTIAPDGSLSGTPGSDNTGLNTWLVQVDDGNGGSTTLDLEITVDLPILVGYDFSTADPASPTLVAGNLSASAVTSPMPISYDSSFGDNSGVTASGLEFGSPDSLGALALQVIDATTSSFENAIAGDDYITFTVTPNIGTGIQLSSLTFKVTKKSLAAVDEYAVTDAAGNSIGSPTVITNIVGLTGAYDGISVDLAGTDNEYITAPTEFRIYAWGRGSSSASNTLAAIDKVTLHGSNYLAPVAYWELDDGSSTTALDSSGNGFDGTIANATSVTGKVGLALDFNGTDTDITLPASVFASIDQEITISMWAYGAANQARQDTLFSAKDAAGNRLLNIHLPWSNSQVYWDAGWNSGYDRINKVATAAQFKDNWSHWVFVKNATTGTMEIYHNGTLFHSGTAKVKSMAGITGATLGSEFGTSNYAGSVDDLIIYDSALTAEEIAELYNSYE
ncbi:Ig-like domain-containing protein [Rubritalea sp.]|uniref:Ig-like domain-containing protein n=1 Tax=Rubritalea sp. TaxID=2109375 RepID=UPI003EF0E171